MNLYFAPMEGITLSLYRRLHSELFGGADKYFAPFIAPNGDGSFKAASLRELQKENNGNICLIPQILCNSAAPFLITCETLRELAYEEVNLNIGCPSATVVSKHKGSGMLTDLDSLRRCLDEIYEKSPLAVSIKTRMGYESTEEFPSILELYKQYPVKELTVHARSRAGMYSSVPDLYGFKAAMESCPFPICYNGNIFKVSDFDKLCALCGDNMAVMIGRGAVANPALFRQLRGGEALKLEELRHFHDSLLDALLQKGLDPHHAVSHMKELWFYMRCMFPGSEREIKLINKSKRLPDYRTAAASLFSGCNFEATAGFVQPTK